MQEPFVNKDGLPEQQVWNQNLDKKNLDPPNIKEEQEELWNEDEEKPQSSQLQQTQKASNSAEPRTLKIEVDGDDCGGSQAASNSQPRSHFQPHTDDMRQVLVIKEKILPQHQECKLTVDQKGIKEEEQQLWICQQGQQLHPLEEVDITKFTAVPVKSEYNEKPQSSQLHQSQLDDSTEPEPVASSSSVLRTLTTQADGEDYRGPQQASNSCPYSPSQQDPNDRNTDSSETETDNSWEWKQTRELHSGFNCQTNTNVANQHMEMQESEKQFACSECGKRFRLKGNLIKHLRIHSGEKPFDCSECGKRFGQKSNLMTHMRIHTGVKQFICSECGKKFGRKGNLMTHMRIHMEEKTFGCSECGRRFTQKSNVISHMRIHMGLKRFGCSDCGKIFQHKNSLITHKRIHMGQKPFVCSDCGKIFQHKNSLITHTKIHMGEIIDRQCYPGGLQKKEEKPQHGLD